MARLPREDEPVKFLFLGPTHPARIPDDQLVAVRVAREVAEQRARAQVGLLAPHPLESRLEVLGDKALPLLALDAAPAPMKLEQDVRVEGAVDRVHVDLDLAPAPVRRPGGR